MLQLAETASTNAPAWLPYAIILGFPIVFITIWSGVCLLLGAIGGWQDVARRYPATTEPEGKSYSSLPGFFGIVSYRFVLKVHVAPGGMYIGISKFFKIGHPPIFLPWSEIHNASLRRLLFIEKIAFEVGRPKIATVQLPVKVFEGTPIHVEGLSRPDVPPPLP